MKPSNILPSQAELEALAESLDPGGKLEKPAPAATASPKVTEGEGMRLEHKTCPKHQVKYSAIWVKSLDVTTGSCPRCDQEAAHLARAHKHLDDPVVARDVDAKARAVVAGQSDAIVRDVEAQRQAKLLAYREQLYGDDSFERDIRASYFLTAKAEIEAKIVETLLPSYAADDRKAAAANLAAEHAVTQKAVAAAEAKQKFIDDSKRNGVWGVRE